MLAAAGVLGPVRAMSLPRRRLRERASRTVDLDAHHAPVTSADVATILDDASAQSLADKYRIIIGCGTNMPVGLDPRQPQSASAVLDDILRSPPYAAATGRHEHPRLATTLFLLNWVRNPTLLAEQQRVTGITSHYTAEFTVHSPRPRHNCTHRQRFVW